MIDDHLNSLTNCLNQLCKTYENIILSGDFNSEMCEDPMKLFCSSYNLKNLTNEPTCFKKMDNPSCIVISSLSTIIGDKNWFIRFPSLNNDNQEYKLSKTDT